MNPQVYVPSQSDLTEQAKYRATPLPPLVGGSRTYGCYADRMRVLKAVAAAASAENSCCLPSNQKPVSLFGTKDGCCSTPAPAQTLPCNCS